MTEERAIEVLGIMKSQMKEFGMTARFEGLREMQETAVDVAVKSLSEIQQYRSIGTVEECREARERQRGKKPVMKPFYEDMKEEYLCCPTCGDILTDRIPMDNKDFYYHCLNCGQKLDWHA